MKLNSITPMLETESVKATIAFYTEKLGFQCLNKAEDESGKSYWAILEKDGIELMFSSRNAHSPYTKPCMSGVLYFNLEDVDAAWEKLHKQAEVVYPIENFDYGMREFAIYDNNGYVLSFGKSLNTSL